jgi:hypothetical protein
LVGGFWDVEKQCYVHWHDKDNSIHGRNLVVPVNFMAIAYGLCDDRSRRQAILNRIEQQMQQENLFAWPICLESYAPGEGLAWQFPFPNYENGDLFLGWGQLGVAAYANENPDLAVKYIVKLLAQYRRDGLAFQRYLRKTQTGSGDDILANNAMALVGLYRDIYGIQPKHDRLTIAPHLIPELAGTKLNYRLRGKKYVIELEHKQATVNQGAWSLTGLTPFSLDMPDSTLQFFPHPAMLPTLKAQAKIQEPVRIDVSQWQIDQMSWMESGDNNTINYSITGLPAGIKYAVKFDARTVWHGPSNGTVTFSSISQKSKKIEIVAQ